MRSMWKLVRREQEIGVDNERRAAAGSSWWPTTTTNSRPEEAGMRKRKEAQAPSVSVDMEEKTPLSEQVYRGGGRGKGSLHKGVRRKQRVCETLLRWSPTTTSTTCTASDEELPP